MASPTSKSDISAAWPGRVIRHDDFARVLEARREEVGDPAMPRNSGNRRTTSKRALLKALDDLGAQW